MSHPEHTLVEEVPGYPEPVIPPEPRGWAGFRQRRACRQQGGHWWHPVDPMIGWGCCNCGARTDGMPKDGR
jgi:hypothetical protein